MKHIKIDMDEEDFKGEYNSPLNCPIAKALNRKGYKDVLVGGSNVDFRKKGFFNIFKGKQTYKIGNFYLNGEKKEERFDCFSVWNAKNTIVHGKFHCAYVELYDNEPTKDIKKNN